MVFLLLRLRPVYGEFNNNKFICNQPFYFNLGPAASPALYVDYFNCIFIFFNPLSLKRGVVEEIYKEKGSVERKDDQTQCLFNLYLDLLRQIQYNFGRVSGLLGTCFL